ncbi:MAG: FtsW/RodA/SpoVE family cell cycle protein [Patescibacteria group bacterium]
MFRVQNITIRFDWILLLSVLALASVGLIIMYGIGISRPDSTLFIFRKQLLAIGIGLACLVVLAFIDARHVRGLALPIYVFGAVMLTGVLAVGRFIRGTRGWYTFGSLSFQPVEVAKVCLVIFLASYLVRFVHSRLPLHVIAGSFFATLLYSLLVFLQPDFGSALVLFAIWGGMILFAGLPMRAFAVIAGITAVVAACTWMFLLQPYQKQRFIAFFEPSADALGAGYNVKQAGIAIGSGGWFGKGIGEGSQSRLRFLPEATTDFTFAVIGEELGFIGIAFIMIMYGLLAWRFMAISGMSEDDFASLVLFGAGTVFLIHILVNAGMNLGIMPVTGIPLPFISGASSFMLASFLFIGLAESFAVHRRAAG